MIDTEGVNLSFGGVNDILAFPNAPDPVPPLPIGSGPISVSDSMDWTVLIGSVWNRLFLGYCGEQGDPIVQGCGASMGEQEEEEIEDDVRVQDVSEDRPDPIVEDLRSSVLPIVVLELTGFWCCGSCCW